MQQAAASILLVDDDHIFLHSTRDYAQLKGCEVHTASTVRDAMRTVEQHAPPDLMLLDLSLPDGSGLDVLDRLDAKDCGEVIVLTGQPDVDTAVRAMHLRVDDYVVKPMRGGYFDMLLQRAVQRAQSRSADGFQRSAHCGELFGNSLAMRRMFKLIERVAPMDNTILVHGESGVGKELVARAIHQYSGRHGPFVAVNCGAVPADLIGSQLFGHERGSFTGAVRDHAGYFEQAQGGTLFLDEVAELPPAAQVRLLRVLQEGELVRVGGAQTIAVDVRIVAATHRDLAAMVEAGAFREDLFFRISAFPIVIPPLRERASDIAELAHHFAARAARRFQLPAIDLELYDLELLADYAWPGNVRELATVIDRAVLLGEGRRIDIARALNLTPRTTRLAEARLPAATPPTRRAEAALPATTPMPEPAPAAPAHALAPPSVPEGPDAIEPLDDVIRRHIERALAACQGRIDGPFGAARKLQINPHTLRARMRKLGVDWHRHRARD